MKNVVVVGYPKSGNTWITRLVAELLNCPVKGFWKSKKDEIAKEGMSRTSEFICYKSHHQFYELQEKDEMPDKIIYVIRDPRDVTISGKNFFRTITLMDPDKTSFKALADFTNKVYYKTIGKEVMKKRMIQAILYGDKEVHNWCKVSWQGHLLPYLENDDVCKVTYEGMLEDPLEGCKKLVAYLGIDKSTEEIQQAIDNQSFAKAKEKFKKENAPNKANFLRRGGSGYWRENLSNTEKKKFIDEIGPMLQRLDYPL